jgi:DnaJ-class molecular chaperone
LLYGLRRITSAQVCNQTGFFINVTRDPYQVLGLPRTASEADIKKAFRKLAKIHHPDRAGKDEKAQTQAKEQFGKINTAYEILGDEKKRAQFDRGEIDADGKAKFKGFDGFGGGGAPHGQGFGTGPGFDASDIFGQMFGDAVRRNPRPRTPPPPQKGQDLTATLSVTLAESVEGATRRLALPGGREIDVTLPKGIADGKMMRLRGLGRAGAPGAEAGDVMLTIKVVNDPRFEIDGHDLRSRVPVSLEIAVLGGPVRANTLTGQVELNLPPMTSSGKTFRLKGRGLPAGEKIGDLYIIIDIALPQSDPELQALFEARRALT